MAKKALDRLPTEAIKRRQAADALLSVAVRLAAAGIEPMSMDEIDPEVKAVHAERRQRGGPSMSERSSLTNRSACQGNTKN